ncbi:hypothetical protein Taro_004287 [Colocasia esculenta]|uniref:Uncharacterized protein n=1 Tax=Colocasia esculenta TaxID=4460 RepID=A0A843TJN5_COLES|nr:hypothetical protein [Colocasia esculenta]
MPGSNGNGRLSWILLFSFLVLAAVHGAERASPAALPTHSNFLRAALRGGRHGRLTCGQDPGVCLDRGRNPWGGGTCCFGRFCKDTVNDPDHCGTCGRRCGFGLACCGGQCVDVRSDPRHCGSCHLPCPDGVACSFSMCDYGGGGF